MRKRVRTSSPRRHGLFALLVVALLACSSPSTGSIGVILARDDKTGVVRVHEVPEGLTGDSAGLQPGDRLKMIDGVLVDELDAARIRTLLRGPVGSSVRLTVLRGETVLHVEVTRQALGSKPTASAGAGR